MEECRYAFKAQYELRKKKPGASASTGVFLRDNVVHPLLDYHFATDYEVECVLADGIAGENIKLETSAGEARKGMEVMSEVFRENSDKLYLPDE